MRPDEHRADQAEAERDDDRVGGDRERADDAVEGERRVEHLEVEEQEEPGLAGGLGQLGRTALGPLRPVSSSLVLAPACSNSVAEPVDGEVDDQAEEAGEQHGGRCPRRRGTRRR